MTIYKGIFDKESIVKTLKQFGDREVLCFNTNLKDLIN